MQVELCVKFLNNTSPEGVEQTINWMKELINDIGEDTEPKIKYDINVNAGDDTVEFCFNIMRDDDLDLDNNQNKYTIDHRLLYSLEDVFDSIYVTTYIRVKV